MRRPGVLSFFTMCGFAGFLRGSAAIPDMEGAARAMGSAIVHRGPDAAGVWTDVPSGIALSHQRLSILDLSSAGNQPMVSADGRFVLVYNGEIYNHCDLRTELEDSANHLEWKGHSDTETLLASIQTWGLEATLSRAKGMFALALWDRKERRLSLARDRIGEKPLYYGWCGGSFVFGSELKALRAHPRFSNDVSRDALTHYLRHLYVPAPFSIYERIYKLEPGCILDISASDLGNAPMVAPRPATSPRGGSQSGIALTRWYSLTDTAANGLTDPINDPVTAEAELERVLCQAVERQSLADVPLGGFLSGGVDSSLILALMQEQSDVPVSSFTIGFDEPAYNEAPFANDVATHLGTAHRETIVTAADARNIIPTLPSLYDEPFADSSQIPTHLVCAAARKQVTVALSGDGGDELFGGYNRHLWGPSLWSRASVLPVSMRRLFAAAVLSIPAGGWSAANGIINRVLPGATGIARLEEKAEKLATRLGDAMTLDDFYIRLVSEWQKPEAIVIGGASGIGPLLADPLPAIINQDPATQMMIRDGLTYLPDDILCKVDRAAMAVSLETRVPFLDPDVVEMAWRIPTELKIRGGEGKSILRQLLYKRVPKALIERPKVGFGVPIGQWLRGPLRDWAEDLLDAEQIRADGFFVSAEVEQAWHDHLAGKRDETGKLWGVLMFQAWRKDTL